GARGRGPPPPVAPPEAGADLGPPELPDPQAARSPAPPTSTTAFATAPPCPRERRPDPSPPMSASDRRLRTAAHGTALRPNSLPRGARCPAGSRDPCHAERAGRGAPGTSSRAKAAPVTAARSDAGDLRAPRSAPPLAPA